MTTILALAAAAGVTWMLRVTFIAAVPAERLPVRVRGALEQLPSAVMAGLVASHLAHGAGPAGLLSPALAAAAVAALVAAVSRSFPLTVLAGIAAAAVLGVH